MPKSGAYLFDIPVLVASFPMTCSTDWGRRGDSGPLFLRLADHSLETWAGASCISSYLLHMQCKDNHFVNQDVISSEVFLNDLQSVLLTIPPHCQTITSSGHPSEPCSTFLPAEAANSGEERGGSHWAFHLPFVLHIPFMCFYHISYTHLKLT